MPAELAGRETARTRLTDPSEDPLAAARGFVIGIMIGLGMWAAVVFLAAVIA